MCHFLFGGGGDEDTENMEAKGGNGMSVIINRLEMMISFLFEMKVRLTKYTRKYF